MPRPKGLFLGLFIGNYLQRNDFPCQGGCHESGFRSCHCSQVMNKGPLICRTGNCRDGDKLLCNSHCFHCKDPEGGSKRSKGGGASLPLLDVGKGLPATVHSQQWEPKEARFRKFHEAVGLADHTMPTTIQHRVASRRPRSSCQRAVLPSLERQALHR